MMVQRPDCLKNIKTAANRSPVTTLLGPRQCGKTTLARVYGNELNATYFDLESLPDQRRLQNPELMLGSLKGLVVLDESRQCPICSESCAF